MSCAVKSGSCVLIRLRLGVWKGVMCHASFCNMSAVRNGAPPRGRASLFQQSLLFVQLNVEHFPAKLLTSLPVHLRQLLLKGLPVADLVLLCSTPVVEDLDLKAVWRPMSSSPVNFDEDLQEKLKAEVPEEDKLFKLLSYAQVAHACVHKCSCLSLHGRQQLPSTCNARAVKAFLFAVRRYDTQNKVCDDCVWEYIVPLCYKAHLKEKSLEKLATAAYDGAYPELISIIDIDDVIVIPQDELLSLTRNLKYLIYSCESGLNLDNVQEIVTRNLEGFGRIVYQ